jgi:fatty-acyl-CoA synthase
LRRDATRRDAAVRLVGRIGHDQLGLRDARIQAEEGGRRGMRVKVAAPEAARSSVSVVEEALAAYLFETQVTVG